MKIGYRRFAGAIGITDSEKGTRGLWLEKRLALWDVLESRGHEIVPFNRITKESSEVLETNLEYKNVDLLMMEFGGTNGLFYGDDIAGSIDMAKQHRGPIIFICDDPDLICRWKWFDEKDWARWSLWVNCPIKDVDKSKPDGVPVLDFPFGSLLTPRPYSQEFCIDKFAYVGRPKGRTDRLEQIAAASEIIAMYGKPKEWVGTPWENDLAGSPPDQSKRSDFYHGHLGCLLFTDKKHKKLKWRTGRVYHALMAGCPVAVEADNELFNFPGFPKFENAEDLISIYEKWMVTDPKSRAKAVKMQLDQILQEVSIANETLEESGL